MKVEIIKAENGFITIVQKQHGEENRIHGSLEDAIQSIGEDALMHFEGRARTFTGKSYGEVVVDILDSIRRPAKKRK